MADLGLYSNWKASWNSWIGNVLQVNANSHLKELLPGGHQPVLTEECQCWLESHNNETEEALSLQTGNFQCPRNTSLPCILGFFLSGPCLWDDFSTPAQRRNILKNKYYIFFSLSTKKFLHDFQPCTWSPMAAYFSSTQVIHQLSCWASRASMNNRAGVFRALYVMKYGFFFLHWD